VPVEFVVNINNLRQAIEQLMANRGHYSESDFVDIAVSENTALLRAVGMESEARVDSQRTGSVRIPLTVLYKIAEAMQTWKTTELPFHCEPGAIKIGKFSVAHAKIELDKPAAQLSLPINLSLLDTLALAKLFTLRRLEEDGMRVRVERAGYSRRAAIANALAALRELEIEERQLNQLVDCHIDEAAKRLNKTLQAA
jgi:hypothetical protein